MRPEQRSGTPPRSGIPLKVLEPVVRPKMQTRNDYIVAVVWVAVIGLVVVARWLKVPLG